MKLSRHQFLHMAAGAAALPAVLRIAQAQTYPTKPVRLMGRNEEKLTIDLGLYRGCRWYSFAQP
jgi:hypothetical protein